ncbi:ribosomal protein S18-alanine N-acetyltransferase [Pseudoalteromonas sp. R3]|uniref:ribosomal protein S18-alanine N-acetyltransferase n=1 Tax=Pseudoalteromonas sp. R3 TaxID=1709477 RepID=UPI000A55C797|nr:ribosomal protein S18-alanine N-acetyltransferase [Pseudoalteromonas sp. R3]
MNVAIVSDHLATLPLQQLMDIEQACHSHPWSVKTMQSCLSGRYFNAALYLDERLVGFYVGERAGPDFTLMDICIAPAFQGQGLAWQLLAHFMTRCEQDNAENIFLEVRVSNNAAIGLYQKAGFTEMGVRKNYYPSAQGKEDAVLMGKVLFKPEQADH